MCGVSRTLVRRLTVNHLLDAAGIQTTDLPLPKADTRALSQCGRFTILTWIMLPHHDLIIGLLQFLISVKQLLITVKTRYFVVYNLNQIIDLNCFVL